MKQESLERLFNNIKDGDILGFYNPGIFSTVIKFFHTIDKTADLNALSHVATVYNVKRDYTFGIITLSFDVSEQTVLHGGVFTKWNLTLDERFGMITLDKMLKSKVLYFKSLEKPFTDEQIKLGLYDALSQVGKRYGLGTLFFSVPFASEFLGKIFNIRLLMNSKRVCSKHIMMNHLNAGRNGAVEFVESNPFPTPEGVLTYNKGDFAGEIYTIKHKTILL
jgi:hypothetical protein